MRRDGAAGHPRSADGRPFLHGSVVSDFAKPVISKALEVPIANLSNCRSLAHLSSFTDPEGIVLST
jgi:hypothetical protein